MKKYTLIFLLIIPFLASSQEYEPTIVEGNRWDITYIYGMGNFSRFSDVLSCDTVIDKQVYTVAITYWRNEEGELGSEKSRAYLREDTTSKKIYRKEYVNDDEMLIIDYSLEVGDSMFITGHYQTVDSITQEYMFGELRKTIYLTTSQKFIEGLGYYPFGIYWGDWYSLLDYYNLGDICEDPVSNINLEIKTEYIIYPNPTQGYVGLKLPLGYDKEINLEVFDLNGTTIQKRRIGDNLTVDLSRFQPGLYFIEINGVIKKVIKL